MLYHQYNLHVNYTYVGSWHQAYDSEHKPKIGRA